MNSFTLINQSKLHMSFRNTIRVSNSLDPDQDRRSLGPDLGPNCLQRISARQQLQLALKELKNFTCQKGIFSFCHDEFIHSYQPIKLHMSFRNTIRVSNNLDPDQDRRSVCPDLGPNCLQRISPRQQLPQAWKELKNFTCQKGIFSFSHEFVHSENQSKLHMSFRNTIRVSKSLDPDQDRRSVGPDLGQNCLQRISARQQLPLAWKRYLPVKKGFSAFVMMNSFTRINQSKLHMSFMLLRMIMNLVPSWVALKWSSSCRLSGLALLLGSKILSNTLGCRFTPNFVVVC